ncbi:hypothetical protein HDV00_007495 [Rhizophlyctis rosea]|nr:hypothetical protein HDV00_007495 [Rhizophlyctis rosea]
MCPKSPTVATAPAQPPPTTHKPDSIHTRSHDAAVETIVPYTLTHEPTSFTPQEDEPTITLNPRPYRKARMERWDSVMMDTSFTVDLTVDPALAVQSLSLNGFADDDEDGDGDITSQSGWTGKTADVLLSAAGDGIDTDDRHGSDDGDDTDDDDFYSLNGDGGFDEDDHDSRSVISHVEDVWFDPRPSIEFGFGRQEMDDAVPVRNDLKEENSTESVGSEIAVPEPVLQSSLEVVATDNVDLDRDENQNEESSMVEIVSVRLEEIDEDDDTATVTDPTDILEREDLGKEPPSEIHHVESASTLSDQDSSPATPTATPAQPSPSPSPTLHPTIDPFPARLSLTSLLSSSPSDFDPFTTPPRTSPSPPPFTKQWTPPIRDPWAPPTDPWLPSPPREEDRPTMSMRDGITSLANARRMRTRFDAWDSDAWAESGDGRGGGKLHSRVTSSSSLYDLHSHAMEGELTPIIEDEVNTRGRGEDVDGEGKGDVSVEPKRRSFLSATFAPAEPSDTLTPPTPPQKLLTHPTQPLTTPFGRFHAPIRVLESRLDSVLRIPDAEDADGWGSDGDSPNFGDGVGEEGGEDGEMWDEISLNDRDSVYGGSVGRGGDDTRSVSSGRSGRGRGDGLGVRRASVKNLEELLYGPGARDGVDTGKIMGGGREKGGSLKEEKGGRKGKRGGEGGRVEKGGDGALRTESVRGRETGWEELVQAPYPVVSPSFTYYESPTRSGHASTHRETKHKRTPSGSSSPFSSSQTLPPSRSLQRHGLPHRPRASLQLESFRSPSSSPSSSSTPTTINPSRATSIDTFRTSLPITTLPTTSLPTSHPSPSLPQRNSEDTHPLPHFNLLLYGVNAVQRKRGAIVRGQKERERERRVRDEEGRERVLGGGGGVVGGGRWGNWVASGLVVGVPEGARVRM